MVSHNGKWSVGSSVAVSEFLRPLCLYTRVKNLKQSLKKAIVFYQPLDTADNQKWSSSAIATNVEGKSKPPCQNCAMMFEKLVGFINPTSEQGGRDTFLGACAEYCPVDQLLADEVLSPKDNLWINCKLQRNREQCRELFSKFRDIENKCNEAYGTKDEILRNKRCTNVYSEIKQTIHIFGRKPECNEYFGGCN